MTASQQIIYQNPQLAEAYLWAFGAFLVFCLIMGILELIQKGRQ